MMSFTVNAIFQDFQSPLAHRVHNMLQILRQEKQHPRGGSERRFLIWQ
jgi:hypothetical protein